MKKKLIAIAIAAAVAAPLTAQAAVTVSGDAEFKMTHYETTGLTYNDNGTPADFTDDTAEDQGGWSGSNRVRVKIDADLDGGVSAHTRFRTTTGFDNSGADAAAGVTSLTVDTDYSYLMVPVSGSVTLQMGDQLATWGTKYFADGALKSNRLKAIFKANEQLTLLATLDPIGDENGDGAPKMSFYGVYKMGNMLTTGLAYTAEWTTYNGTADGTVHDAVSNFFVKGQVAGVTFGLESTDWAEYDGSRSLYVMAGMKAGPADIGLHIVNAGAQDSDWSPIGVINGDANLAGGQNEYTVLTVGMKAGGMDIAAGFGNAGNETVSSVDNESFVGVDLGKKFGAANFNFSYGSYNDATAYGFSFKTKF